MLVTETHSGSGGTYQAQLRIDLTDDYADNDTVKFIIWTKPVDGSWTEQTRTFARVSTIDITPDYTYYVKVQTQKMEYDKYDKPRVVTSNFDDSPEQMIKIAGLIDTADIFLIDLDAIADGTDYEKVLKTSISAGTIILSGCSGDLDDIDDGTTYERTTGNEVTGAGRAYTGLDASGNLVTAVHPGSSVATPDGAGLYLGSDYMGYFDNTNWKTYMDVNGNFYLGGSSGKLQWVSATNTLTVEGTLQTASSGGKRAVISGADNNIIFYDTAGEQRITIDETSATPPYATGIIVTDDMGIIKVEYSAGSPHRSWMLHNHIEATNNAGTNAIRGQSEGTAGPRAIIEAIFNGAATGYMFLAMSGGITGTRRFSVDETGDGYFAGTLQCVGELNADGGADIEGAVDISGNLDVHDGIDLEAGDLILGASGDIKLNQLTASRNVYLDANKELKAQSSPSLVELAYLAGCTGVIQDQINAITSKFSAGEDDTIQFVDDDLWYHTVVISDGLITSWTKGSP